MVAKGLRRALSAEKVREGVGRPYYVYSVTPKAHNLFYKDYGDLAKLLLEELGRRPEDYRYVVFHQPNTKFPQRVGAQLGFSKYQIATGLLVPMIGNTYAGAAMIGLTAILDVAEPGQRILMVSFGSGAGSDAFAIRVPEAIEERRDHAPKTGDYIARRIEEGRTENEAFRCLKRYIAREVYKTMPTTI